MKPDDRRNQGRGPNPQRVSGGQFIVLCVLGYLAVWLLVATLTVIGRL